MISRKNTFFLGIFIFLVPFMGIPTFWKTLFIVLSALSLVFSSITISIPAPKKSIKHRTKKSQKVSVEAIPTYLNDEIISDMVYKEKSSKNKIIE